MWGMVLGGAILGVLVLLAAARPLRFRVAMGYAWAARKAMLPVILGLSTITAVIGAAAIIEDSAVQGVRDSFVSPFHAVDGVIGSRGDEGIEPSGLDAFLDHPDMAPILDDTPVRMAQLAAEGPTGLGGVRQDFWSVEPGDYSSFVDFQVLDGSIPSSWQANDAVLDERGAVEYGIVAGDELTVFIGAAPVPFLDERDVEGSYDVVTPAAPVVALADNQTGRQSDSRLLASFEGETGDYIVVAVQQTAVGVDSDDNDNTLAIRIDAPGEERDGAYQLNNEDAPESSFYVDNGHEGTWDIYIEPWDDVLTTDVEYSGTIRHEGHRLPDPRVETFTVRAIVDDAGTPLQDRATVLVAPAAHSKLFDSAPPVNTVFLDIDDDVDHARFQADMDRVADEAFENGAYAWDVQYEVEQRTAEIEQAVGPTFIAFGALSIGAGIVLVIVLVNIIVEERRRVLGTLRAVGGTRGQVQTMVLHELGLVALASVLFGLLFATALAGGVRGLMQALIVDEGGSGLAFVVRPLAILDAAGWAFALILVSAWFGARRALRASPNELLRDHPDPPSKRAWIARLLLILFSAALAIPLLLYAPPSFALLLAGSAVAITVAWALSKLIRFPFLVDIVLIGLWVAIAIAMFTQTVEDEIEVLLYPLEGLLLVAFGATLLVRSKLVHLGMVAFLSGPLRSLGEMATGNLRDRPARQTAILAVLAVSILMITAMSMMFQSFSPTPTDDGGFPVVGESPVAMGSPAEYLEANPPTSGADPFDLAELVVQVPYTYRWESFGIRETSGDNTYVRGPTVGGGFDIGLLLTDPLAGGFEFEEVEYAPGVAGWDDAVQRVQTDRDAVIVNGEMRVWRPDGGSDRGGEYEEVTFDTPLIDDQDDSPIDVVAIVPGASNWAVLMGQERFERSAGPDPDKVYFFKPNDGVSSRELAESVGSAFRSAGMVVTDMDEEAREERRVEITIQSILGLFMGLGILVGMLSLALIAQRTYQQRRGSLAILRAIGASRERVMAGFVVEQVFVVVLAVILGVVVGLMMAGSMIVALDEGFKVQVNAAFITGVLGATLLGGTLVGLMPALKIRRMKLAEALRYE